MKHRWVDHPHMTTTKVMDPRYDMNANTVFFLFFLSFLLVTSLFKFDILQLVVYKLKTIKTIVCPVESLDTSKGEPQGRRGG